MTELSPQLFAIFSSLVEERLGLHYGVEDKRVFSDKIVGAMNEAGFENPLDYYYALRYDDDSGAETDALADVLVVGETYFFRELVPLRVAISEFIEPAVRRRGRARIWSAACATGEEPTTIAMLLADAGILPQCEILATDVSGRALARARTGIYGPRSLRAIGDDAEPLVRTLSDRWIARDQSSEGAVGRVARAIVDAVEYRRVNLLETAAISALGTFDLVSCRNVLIYFEDRTVQRVVSSLCRALAPQGRIIVGASESLLRFGTLLHCEERGGAFFYAKDP
jgi:chemotaxis protein methyltransferase CheR